VYILNKVFFSFIKKLDLFSSVFNCCLFIRYCRVTIDTLMQLTRSSLAIGGWSEEGKQFFLASSDPHSQEIGNKFELTENEENAIKRVAKGTFSYYESSYLLQHARGKLIYKKENSRYNKSEKDTESGVKYNLHIMEECAVHMPIALGLEKNSPLKPHVDLWVFRLVMLIRKKRLAVIIPNCTRRTERLVNMRCSLKRKLIS